MPQFDYWFCDGTFSSAPSLFYQLYTIHAVQYSNVLPSVYILLPNKKENTYKRMFQALKTIEPNLSPKTIMVDLSGVARNLPREGPTRYNTNIIRFSILYFIFN